MNDKIREVAFRVREECGCLDPHYKLTDFLTRCLAELSITEQDKLDAARYRLLRGDGCLNFAVMHSKEEPPPCLGYVQGWKELEEKYLDAAVDHAMENGK